MKSLPTSLWFLSLPKSQLLGISVNNGDSSIERCCDCNSIADFVGYQALGDYADKGYWRVTFLFLVLRNI